MPLLDYDYDYLASYEVKRQHDRDELYRRKQQEKERAYKKTSAKTREQVRQFMLESSEPIVTRRRTSFRAEPALETGVSFGRRIYDFENVESQYRFINYNDVTKTNLNVVEEVEEEAEEAEVNSDVAKDSSANTFKNALLFIAVAIVALFICYRYSIINEKFNSVSRTIFCYI